MEFPRLVGRYCCYLLPKQTGGTTQILIFQTLRMIGHPALYRYVFFLVLFLTEQRYATLGESLLILADAVVSAKVCGVREGDLQRHGRLVHAVLLQSQPVLARPLPNELAVVPLPVVDRGGVRLHRALHRGGGAVVAAQHLSVDADEGGNCKYHS